LERLSTFGHYPGDESDKYVGASAATTVVRKVTYPKVEHRLSNSSDGAFGRHSLEQNHQILTNKHTNEPRTTIRQTSPINPFNNTNFNNNYSGQQLLLTSGDIEAMTMKQFRMGSLGY
jgi:hypothetical protein